MSFGSKRRFVTLSQGVPWWRRPEHLLDGVAPAFFADVLNLRAAIGAAVVPLASVLTVTAASGKTYCDANGTIKTAGANEARIDWSGGAPELLLEGPSTNLFLYSEDFTQAAWTKSNCTVTPSAGLAQTGAVTATKVATNNTLNSGHIRQDVSMTSGIQYSVSIYVAQSGFSWLYIFTSDGATALDGWVNVATGATANVAVGLTITVTAAAFGARRISATRVSGNTGTGNFRFYPASSVGAPLSSVTGGNGTDGVLVWGAQCEAQGAATSYIPTSGSAVTRATDLCQLTAGAAAAIQGASAGIAWRGNIPVAQSGQQIVGLGDGLNLIRATNTPNTRLAIFNATSGLALEVGTDVIPGAVGLCAGWGASGARLAVLGTAAAAAQTNSWPTTIYVGAAAGLATGQTLRLRQLVGWTLADRPTAAAVAAQARVAA